MAYNRAIGDHGRSHGHHDQEAAEEHQTWRLHMLCLLEEVHGRAAGENSGILSVDISSTVN